MTGRSRGSHSTPKAIAPPRSPSSLQTNIAKFRNDRYPQIVAATERRTYPIRPIQVNDRKIVQVVIDSHYEKRHSKAMSDELILKLVAQLDGRKELPEASKGPYSFFATLIEHHSKQYRLIWLLEEDAIYIGVVNAYRDRRKKRS